jgi:hypothetical protein
MIPKTDKTNTQRSADRAPDRSWSDLEQLARRVIRAANLAVLTHAELEFFTGGRRSGGMNTDTGKKAG